MFEVVVSHWQAHATHKLLLGSTMAAESSTYQSALAAMQMKLDLSSQIDKATVLSGVDGGDMYTDEGLLIMVYLKRWGVGFGGELPENGLLFQIRFRHWSSPVRNGKSPKIELCVKYKKSFDAISYPK